MSTEGYLQCRFCEYRVLRWRGYKVPGTRKLLVHVQECHHEEYQAIFLGSHQETATFKDKDGLVTRLDIERTAADQRIEELQEELDTLQRHVDTLKTLLLLWRSHGSVNDAIGLAKVHLTPQQVYRMTDELLGLKAKEKW